MSNNLRKIIRECFQQILFEDKRGIITDKIKLPQFVADWIHNEISEKYAIWFANHFKKNFLINQVPGEFVRNQIISQLEKGMISGGLIKLIDKYKNLIEGEYIFISDWLSGRGDGPARENDILNLKTLTFEEALNRSEQWHDRLAELSQPEPEPITDEDGEVVKTFPDGYYWLNLGKRNCNKEARAMGHCGNAQGTLFSLRKDGVPHITADIMPNGIVRQMRGRGNSKPRTAYHPYIVDFITSDNNIKSFSYNGYKESDNFWLKDLEKNDIQSILNEKPSLANNQRILDKIDYDVLERVVSSNEIKISPEDFSNLLRKYGEENLRSLYDLNPNSFSVPWT